jgi:hypothetical protein
MANKKHLSNTEWGLIVGFLAMIDLTMFLLDFTGIGEFVDPFADTFIAMAFPFYMHMRGQDMTNNKRVAGAIITWLTALFSDGFLDFWFVDALYYWSLDRAAEELEKLENKVPGGKMVGKIAENKISGQKRKYEEMMNKFPSKNTAGSKPPRWLNDNMYNSKSSSSANTKQNLSNLDIIENKQEKNFSPAEYDKFNKAQREKMGLTEAMPGSKSSGGGYDKWNKERNEKMGLTQGIPGSRSGNKAGDPFHSGGINGDYYVSGGGEKVLMPTRSTKTPKSYEQVLEDEKKHYDEWNSKKAA